MNPLYGQFINLVISLLIAAVVWGHYKKRRFPLSEKYSTFAPRFWTGSVDGCVLWPVGFLAAVLLSLELPKVLVALITIVQTLTWLAYTIHMHAKYGQTYGKMVCKVKVVDFQTEGAITFRQAFIGEAVPMAVDVCLLGFEVFLIMTGKLSRGAKGGHSQKQHVLANCYYARALVFGRSNHNAH